MISPCAFKARDEQHARSQSRSHTRPQPQETSHTPNEDFTGQLKLELSDHVFDPPKYSEDECRERDMTFARPLFVTARFMNAQHR